MILQWILKLHIECNIPLEDAGLERLNPFTCTRMMGQWTVRYEIVDNPV